MPPMRPDQYAHQQATRVAGLGLIVLLAVGLVLLVMGRAVGSTALVHASALPFVGVLAWAILAVVGHQQRLVALESLEAEELRATRGASTVFDSERAADSMVATRRLDWMLRVLVPAASLALAGALAAAGTWTVRTLSALDGDLGADAALEPPVPFSAGGATGWQLAVCVGLALVCFIFARFAAGMSRQPAWQNLRGGACMTVGTSLALLAIAVGLVADAFGQAGLLEDLTFAIGIGELAIAAEVVLNFVLALYRPRRAGEVPRPAFDSRVLSLVAAPDSIVRSINEAVNYQFGFDITSSWGYQLLLRSTAWLVGLGTAVLVAMSCVVVVPPGQQAVRLRGGAIVGDVYEATVMLKWPWPVETAAVHEVARIRTLVLGPRPMKVGAVNTWGDESARDQDRFQYMVAAPNVSEQVRREAGSAGTDDAAAQSVAERFALVDADVVMSYRIAPDGLLAWLDFASDARFRRAGADVRERLVRDIALREVTQQLATQPMDDVLSPRGDSLVRSLRERIQGALDRAGSGVEVVAVQVPALRPPAGEGAGMFEEISIDRQNARKMREEADRLVRASMAAMAGTPERAAEIVAAIEAYERAERSAGESAPETLEARAKAESLIMQSRGAAAGLIAAARARRWAIVMGAAGDAAQVLGQAPSYRAAPELYKQFRTMQVLGRALASARAKFVLGPGVSGRTDLDVTMKQAESGLNLADYLERKEPASGGRNP